MTGLLVAQRLAVDARRRTGPAPEGAGETAGIAVPEGIGNILYRVPRKLEGIAGGTTAAALNQIRIADTLFVEQPLQSARAETEQTCDIFNGRVTPVQQGMDQTTAGIDG